MERVGLAKSKTGEADNSDEIDSDVEQSDDSDTKKYKEKLQDTISIGNKDYTIG